jgi:hypothetical protein
MNAVPEPGRIDEIDVAILNDLAGMWGRLDPVPAGLAERTKFALTMHSLEAELAELISAQPALTRLDDDLARAESVTFTSSRASILVTVEVTSATSVRVEGWVTPAGALVRAHSSLGEQTTTADDTGRFAFDEVARGELRFAVWPEGVEGERPVVTPPIDV